MAASLVPYATQWPRARHGRQHAVSKSVVTRSGSRRYASGMADSLTTCIYCSNAFDPRVGEGDHVLPRGFGSFDGEITFRGTCSSCNNSFSPLEEEILRTAPEAILRRYAGAATNRRGEAVGWQAASGIPSPTFVIKHADHDELIDADPSVGGQSYPVDQLVVVLKDGRNVHVRLFPSMSPDAIRRKLVQQGVADGDISHSCWHADEEKAELYAELLKKLWPEHRHEERPATEAGVHRVPVRIECRFSVNYYRAIMKIAFHYFLANSRCGFTGHEGCFEPIRSFIMAGGQHEPFFENQKPKIMMPVGELPDGTALLPARWMHMLCCIESLQSVVVGVYTLFGPESPPTPHFVTVLHRPGVVLVREHQYGHAYIYGNPALGDDRDAFVEPVQVGRIR